MNAREKILAKVAAATNKLEKKSAIVNYSVVENKYSMQDFENSLLAAGGTFAKLNSLDTLNGSIQRKILDTSYIKNIVSLVNGVEGSSNFEARTQATPITNDYLSNIDLVVMYGAFGVKENGAVWINCEQLPHSALPFITKHLVIVINNWDFVDNMHMAYQKVADMPSYGVFIAGPSKTADIERCTVIGAQCPLSLDVVII
jgi:L-lactate dehydrogenase complex protein LldG